MVILVISSKLAPKHVPRLPLVCLGSDTHSREDGLQMPEKRIQDRQRGEMVIKVDRARQIQPRIKVNE